jgi:pyruvate dehydrogenase E2 component (dihydrolipoamide acetyltransferase)
MSIIEKECLVKERKNLDLPQRIIASKTMEGWTTIPHIAGQVKPCVTEFLMVLDEFKKRRAILNEDLPKITINNIMLKIIAKAIQKAPYLNSILKYDKKAEGGELIILEKINVTMPIMLNELETITVVIPDVANKSVDEITNYVNELKRKLENTDIFELSYQIAKIDTFNKVKKGEIKTFSRIIRSLFGKNKARELTGKAKKLYYSISEDDRLVPSDINCGSLIITNVGSVFKDMLGAITILDIIPPNTFAIALNAIQKEPVVVSKNGTSVIQEESLFPLTYAFDHRCFDFGHMVPFLKEINTIFANPIEFFRSEFSDFEDIMDTAQFDQPMLVVNTCLQ